MVDAPVSPLTIRADQTELTDEQRKGLRLTIPDGKNGPDQTEESLFIHTITRTGLDPYQRMIMMVGRWNKYTRRQAWTVQVTIDGFRTLAHATGEYVGFSSYETYHKTTGELLSATVTVRRLVKGIIAEFSATAWWEEYVQKDKDGKIKDMWAKFRHLMLTKCAESLALRMAFPMQLAGLYTPDEMGQTSNQDDDDQTEQPAPTQPRRQSSRRTEPDVAPADVVWPEPKPRPEPAPVEAPSPTTRWDFDDSMRTIDGIARESDVTLIRAVWMALSHRTLLATPVALDPAWSELYSKITGNEPVDVEYIGKLVAAVAMWTKANGEALYPDLEPEPEQQVVLNIPVPDTALDEWENGANAVLATGKYS